MKATGDASPQVIPMFSMKRHSFQHSTFRLRSFVAGLAHLAVIAVALATTLPAHASDDRAVKQRVAPTYPELAKRMKVSGVVKISATVAADGAVSATKTVSGNHMLSGAAEDAVRRWKFVPATSESTVEVDINFALAQ